MKRITFYIFLLLILSLALFGWGCGCGDDDDDDSGGGPDDDDDDNNDTSGDDDDDDDDDDDNDDNDTALPTLNLIPPVDYDGDGEPELLFEGYKSSTTTSTMYIAELGTFERTAFYTFQITKQTGTVISAEDLDQNGVWDIILTYNVWTAKGTTGHLVVFMNGDLDTPAFEETYSSADSIYHSLMDTDLDGQAEIVLSKEHYADYYSEKIIIDPGNSFSKVGPIGDITTSYMQLHGVLIPGNRWPVAGNFSGSATDPEVVGTYITDDGVDYYAYWTIYNAITGVEIATSPGINIGQGYGYTNFFAGDFDDDGIAEVSIAKNYHEAKDPSYAQHLVYSQSTFDIEFQTTPELDRNYYHLMPRCDMNNDGVLDMLMSNNSISGNDVELYVVDGTQSYSHIMSYTEPTNYRTTPIARLGRGNIFFGSDIKGNSSSNMLMYEKYYDTSSYKTHFLLYDLDESTCSCPMLQKDLGEQGYVYCEVQDLGGDSVMDLACKIEVGSTIDKAIDYETDFFVANYDTDNLVESLTVPMGMTQYAYFFTRFDMTGDHKADLILTDEATLPAPLDIYDCDGGCTKIATIDPSPDDYIQVFGPMW